MPLSFQPATQIEEGGHLCRKDDVEGVGTVPSMLRQCEDTSDLDKDARMHPLAMCRTRICTRPFTSKARPRPMGTTKSQLEAAGSTALLCQHYQMGTKGVAGLTDSVGTPERFKGLSREREKGFPVRLP